MDNALLVLNAGSTGAIRPWPITRRPCSELDALEARHPGSISEGGELGYSVSHAFGAAFDNPDLLAALRVPSQPTFIMNSNRVYDDMIRLIESLEPADRCSEAPQQE